MDDRKVLANVKMRDILWFMVVDYFNNYMLVHTHIEGNLFMWVRLNQHILKTELYNGLNGVIRILTLNKKNL